MPQLNKRYSTDVNIPYALGGSGKQTPSFWDLYGQGVMNSSGAEGGALFQPGTAFDPNYEPQYNWEQVIQNILSPLHSGAQGMADMARGVASLPGWLASPVGGTPETSAEGADISDLFSQYLAMRQGRGGSPGPRQTLQLGQAPKVPQLPKAPTFQTPDYSVARAKLTPPDFPESFDRLQAPYRMTPEDEKQLINSGLLGGAAQGFFQAPSDAFLGEKLLAAGVGTLGGLGSAKENIFDRKRAEERETQDYWLKRADIEQRVSAANTAYSLEESGLERGMAEAAADAANQTAQAEYTRSLEQAKLEIENAQLSRPRFMGSNVNGFMVQHTDPQTNEVTVTTYPFGREMMGAGLMGQSGLLGEAYGLRQTFGGGGVDTATTLIQQLRAFGGPGALSAVFGDDALADVMETIASQLDPTLQGFGTQGQNMGLMQKLSAENFALGQILISNPDALQRALELLVNRGIPQE